MINHRFGVSAIVLCALLASVWWIAGNCALAADETTINHTETKCIDTKLDRIQPDTDKPIRHQDYGNVPLYFIENRGQIDSQVTYYARCTGQTIFFSNEGVTITLTQGVKETATIVDTVATPQTGDLHGVRHSIVRLQPVGMQKTVTITATEPRECKVAYFIGNDPNAWQTDIPTYAGVLYREAFTGIDLKFYGNNKNLEYDIIVRPGADPDRVRFAYQGVEHLEITPAGDLALHLPDGGVLLQKKPIIYQEIDGARVHCDGTFMVHDNPSGPTFGFTIASYDRNHTLIIDPVIAYSTYLGGASNEYGQAIAVDITGAAYITGFTLSANFPTINPLQAVSGSSYDAFVAKLSPAGNALIYATYLGGSGEDEGKGITVDSTGAAYVTGRTRSSDFPVHNAILSSIRGSEDGFIVKLNPAGSSFSYATYFGGTGQDYGTGIAVDTSGSAYVTGMAYSTDLPTTVDVLQTTNAGSADAFAVKLNAAGSALSYATYLGGSGYEVPMGIAIDSAGAAYIIGITMSSDFPISNPIQENHGGGDYDAFVAKLNAAGSVLSYATYLGGNDYDNGKRIAVDSAGAAYITGYTESSNFPTHNPIQGSHGGGDYDAYAAKLNPSGNALVYATYLGGNDSDKSFDIAVDSAGAAHVCGYTESSNFPTRNPLMDTMSGNSDSFVVRINPAGDAFSYATYLGGSGNDCAYGIAVDASGAAYVTGSTGSSDFPTRNAVQGELNGGAFSDVFITKIRQAGTNPALPLLLLQ